MTPPILPGLPANLSTVPLLEGDRSILAGTDRLGAAVVFALPYCGAGVAVVRGLIAASWHQIELLTRRATAAGLVPHGLEPSASRWGVYFGGGQYGAETELIVIGLLREAGYDARSISPR